MNELQINESPERLRPTAYIGKLCATTNGKNEPDFTLQMAFLNDFFYKKPGVHFVRMSIATDRPEEFYKRVTKTLRSLNHDRWRKEPVSGFRICNVQRMTKAWRFTLNLACIGSFYAAVIFDQLRKLHRAYGRTLYVLFNEPRRTLADRAYQQWYSEFYERSHLLKSQVKIEPAPARMPYALLPTVRRAADRFALLRGFGRPGAAIARRSSNRKYSVPSEISAPECSPKVKMNFRRVRYFGRSDLPAEISGLWGSMLRTNCRHKK